ncbi:Protein EDS1B like [Actinidia chinensis var. chinensis]|uniref:Protein EDS1B like n=1 Tax=Actinidia chinensis var. chinensis TaxID=1590841 RepID=A0A2R6QGS9_ACTCC|nr:Protein EDS1B like [Actinidia chinensis var. chinensis]
MFGGGLGESIKMREELMKEACYLSLRAHTSAGKPYLSKKIRGSSETVFSFPGPWTVDGWFSGKPFGQRKIELNLFPSLRSIGNDEKAAVNEAFYGRFEAILKTTAFANEVKKAVTEKKQIIFTGHSSGGPTAILATLWFLEEYIRQNQSHITPLCVTFGSPLVGDHIFPHALRREKWDIYFIHFVTRYDIVPRLMLAPLSSIERELQPVLHFFNPKSQFFGLESITTAPDASTFFMNVMRNVSAVTSHAACHLMGSTNSLLETVTSFIDLSPYRPFGTFVFCTGNGKLVVVKNPDAVLQLLFYSSQLTSEADIRDVACKCLKEHLGYENELQESLQMQNVAYLDDHLSETPLSSSGSVQGELATINTALNDLGLSTRGRLCLRAAGELQKQKQRNQDKIDFNKKEIAEKLESIRKYKTDRDVRKVGYYDAFKLQNDPEDFQANVKRLEVVGLWDEIIEMLKRYALPDEFEGREEWIKLGTEFRRLMEPLDIANYYRHQKNDDTGPYLIKARPKRYRFTQRWREHDKRIAQGSSSESCFWATVEELRNSDKPFEELKETIMDLERDIDRWAQHEEIGKDVFLDESTFAKWWKKLPCQHKKGSCLAKYMSN